VVGGEVSWVVSVKLTCGVWFDIARGAGEGGGRTAHVVVSTVKSFWRKTVEGRSDSEFEMDNSM
jgi:hypothetical protein